MIQPPSPGSRLWLRRGAIALAVIAAAGLVYASARRADAADLCSGPGCDTVALVDSQARFHLFENLETTSASSRITFGNPGDEPLMGDWDCNGVQTPGMYRRSSGFMYLRNSNTSGVADLQFYFGNPGDIPLAGDFNGDGCDTLSIYRPSESKVYVGNTLGPSRADYSYDFGNPGDVPFVGDFDGDGVDSIGLHRRSTGLVYSRDSHSSGLADRSFVFGDPNDVVFAGDWNGSGIETVGAYRPSNGTLYLMNRHAAGVADHQLPVGSYRFAVPAAGSPQNAPEEVPVREETAFREDFDGDAATWPQGDTVGLWQVRYDGFGHVGLTGDGRLRLEPLAVDTPGDTRAALVTSTQRFPGDIDVAVRAETARQLRAGSPPNEWEVAWVVWHYEHDHRFYYVILRSSGWELGKVDNTKLDVNGPECRWPTYENCKYPGAQRYLATGTSPTFGIGEPHDYRISQSGNEITVWGNGRELTRSVDLDNPYRGGRVGLYTEDAEAYFDTVSATGPPS